MTIINPYPLAKAITESGADTIPEALAAVPGAAASVITGGASSAVQTAGKVLDVITAPGFWKRVGVGYLGAMLIILGVVVILAGSKPGQTVIKAGTSIATKGLL